MKKLWSGRFKKPLSAEADDFNSSIHVDYRMYKQDIKGSVAHVIMLGEQNILSKEDVATIVVTLKDILKDIDEGKLEIDMSAEDIHTFIEAELVKRIGDTGKRLHTARSRNDQVALDLRMYLCDEVEEIKSLILDLISSLVDKADFHKDTVMPGYTHMQRAQPIFFAQHLLAYAMMFIRDYGRLEDTAKRMNYSPLGSCALAGTTYDIDRQYTAEFLGFDGPTHNSMDGVSDRDFCIELLGAISIIMMHLSRFSEEIILWASWEFKFIRLDDSYSTGSSIMPQKKNPDIAELVRGKTGRIYGNLVNILTMMKGLPLAYNKDMQEDKEAVFDSVDTVKKCLSVFTPMISTMELNKDEMKKAAQEGFINATDAADYLVSKGMPFRSAYQIAGEIVAYCMGNNFVLETLPLEKYHEFSKLFEEDIYESIDLLNCANRRTSEGGTGVESINEQLKYVKEFLKVGDH